MYMDDIKLFVKNKKRTGFPNTNRIFNEYIGMEFEIEKYALIVMNGKKEKQQKE